jgi:hypothetical protein
MSRRDDEKLHCRDEEQAEHFRASQGAEQAGFSAQDGSQDVEDSCCLAGYGRRSRFLEPSRRRRVFLERSLGFGSRLLLSKR